MALFYASCAYNKGILPMMQAKSGVTAHAFKCPEHYGFVLQMAFLNFLRLPSVSLLQKRTYQTRGSMAI